MQTLSVSQSGGKGAHGSEGELSSEAVGYGEVVSRRTGGVIRGMQWGLARAEDEGERGEKDLQEKLLPERASFVADIGEIEARVAGLRRKLLVALGERPGGVGGGGGEGTRETLEEIRAMLKHNLTEPGMFLANTPEEKWRKEEELKRMKHEEQEGGLPGCAGRGLAADAREEERVLVSSGEGGLVGAAVGAAVWGTEGGLVTADDPEVADIAEMRSEDGTVVRREEEAGLDGEFEDKAGEGPRGSKQQQGVAVVARVQATDEGGEIQGDRAGPGMLL